MSLESVGSCVGGGGAPPPLPLPNPRSPFREEQRFSPNDPDKSYKKSTICYACKREGHWVRECPNKSKESPGPSPRKAKCPPNYPELLCKNCQQPCIVRTSRTEANPGRDFYACRGGQACTMFQWCDEVDKIQSQRVNSPVKSIHQRGATVSLNPICICTAGPCRIETMQHGEWKDRKYFACHLKSGHGSCIHFEWCDNHGDNRGEILNNKDGISSEEMDLVAFPPPPPTTPRADHKTDYEHLGSSPIRRLNLLKGSPSKRKCIEEQVSERVASPSLNCHLNERPSNHGDNLEEILNNKDGISSEEMDLAAFPPPPPTTPRADHKTDYKHLGSSPIRRLNFPEGSPSKRKCIEEQVSERDASPSLNCYLSERPSNVASPGVNHCLNEELKTLEPNRETVGTLIRASPLPLQHSQMKRLSLAEGNSTKHEECLVCGGVGHVFDDCDVLAQLAAL